MESIDYIKDHVEKNIEEIRSAYKEDFSHEIGIFLSGFVNHYNHNSSRELFRDSFLPEIGKLEEKLGRRIRKKVSLQDTEHGGYEVCRILQQRNNQEELDELVKYLNILTTKKEKYF